MIKPTNEAPEVAPIEAASIKVAAQARPVMPKATAAPTPTAETLMVKPIGTLVGNSPEVRPEDLPMEESSTEQTESFARYKQLTPQ